MSSRTEKIPTLSGSTTMSELLVDYPGARRALFARYHIGGCRSCGFSDTETLGEVCSRNENIPLPEAIAHIVQSHDHDVKMQITPQAFVELREKNPAVRLLDVRSREEHEAVSIPGAVMMTQELTGEIFANWSKAEPLVIYDHTGENALDAVAYFIGHGFTEAKALAGGIDAYSIEADQSLPRYKVEMEN